MKTGLSNELVKKCKAVFNQCREFDSHDNLKTVFVVDNLTPYQNELPEANDKSLRADRIIYFLLQKWTSTGDSVLLLFLQALQGNYQEQDEMYMKLHNLWRDIKQELFSPAYSDELFLPQEDLLLKYPEKDGNGDLTDQQYKTCISVNGYYHRSIVILHKKVRRAYQFFKARNEIYPAKCEELLGSCLALQEPVSRFYRFLKNSHLPSSVELRRNALMTDLDDLDILLDELGNFKGFCPECLQAPDQLLPVQELLKKIRKHLTHINNCMKAFNKAAKLPDELNTLFTYVDTALVNAQSSEAPMNDFLVISVSQTDIEGV